MACSWCIRATREGANVPTRYRNAQRGVQRRASEAGGSERYSFEMYTSKLSPAVARLLTECSPSKLRRM